MTIGLDKLKHIVVLMMSGRSFDHMLGGLKKSHPQINGLNGNESNPDAQGQTVIVQPNATFQGQLSPAPNDAFEAVDLQIFGDKRDANRIANMQGFIKSYATKNTSVSGAHAIMNYFLPRQLPVLTTLATQYAVFNGWFSSIPGPPICNRSFAHYGTSFGNVGRNSFDIPESVLSMYERMTNSRHSAKIYAYDEQNAALGIENLRQKTSLWGTYLQFVADCQSGRLPDYSFIEPNYSDHPGPGGGQILACDQHPDHNVKAGERFIAMVYNVIRTNPEIWRNTVLLIVYDNHGGIFDHVIPPACMPDGYVANSGATGINLPFAFDRLGVRVPAVLVSPFVPKGTVVGGVEARENARIFEHASIPATVTAHFLKTYDQRTDREKQAETFLNLLTDTERPDNDCVAFRL